MPGRSDVAGTVIAVGVLAIVLVAASAAWGCIPQPVLFVTPSAAARAGDTVTVRGLNFQGPAEIRLNGIDGRRLATGSGGDFAVKLVVPKIRTGLYALVGVSRGNDGGLTGTATTAFEVVSSKLGATGSGGASATGGGTTARRPSAGAGEGGSTTSSSQGMAIVPAAAAGLGLLLLGALLGTLTARRRRSNPT